MKPSLPWMHACALASFACAGETLTLGLAPPRGDAASQTSTSDVEVTTADASPPAATSDDGTTEDAAATDADAAAGSPAPQFGDVVLVPELTSDAKDDNPTLTSNLLQIYFTSTRGGNADVYMATRRSLDAEFAEPLPVDIVNTDEFDSSPAVDGDGLSLWVGSQRDGGLGGLDIWLSRRESPDAEWQAPELVPELSSPEDDIPRPLGRSGTAMPLGSRRGGDDVYLTYLAERPDPSLPFSEPRLLQELVLDGFNTIDGFISLGGDVILFVHAADDRGDLFIAWSDGDTFHSPLPLDSINTDADERDPWLSPDGQQLYFASDRDGSLQIYRATRVR